MPVRDGLVVSVKPHRLFPQRQDVTIHEGGRGGVNTFLFTREPAHYMLMTSFLKDRVGTNKRVRVWTMDTRHGELIVKVDYAPAREEEGAA
jgi:hypothetical protein